MDMSLIRVLELRAPASPSISRRSTFCTRFSLRPGPNVVAFPHLISARRFISPVSAVSDTDANGDPTFEDSDSDSSGGIATSESENGGVGSSSDKPSGADMMRLFNDAQQNMLFLNKQRLMAIEELQAVQQDKEVLLARVGQLQAEGEAAVAAKEAAEAQLKAARAEVERAKSTGRGSSVSRSRGGSGGGGGGGRGDPSPVWSALLLRIDSLLLSKSIDEGLAGALRERAQSWDERIAEVFQQHENADDRHLAGALRGVLDSGKTQTLHVVHICSELAPLTPPTNAVGSWLLGLCRSTRRKRHTAEVILPGYASIDMQQLGDLRQNHSEFSSFYEGKWHRNSVSTGTLYGLPVTLIHPSLGFFDRDNLYGYEDDFERFTYFSRAALDYLFRTKKSPDVIHLHNWHTAIAAPLFWDVFNQQGSQRTRLLFTCHDFRYQGGSPPPDRLSGVGLDPYHLNRADRLQDNADPNHINLVKGGIVYSNVVTTVSPTYGSDLRNSPAVSCGLQATIVTHQKKFLGLPSGLDESKWDPSRDSFLPVPYSWEDDEELGGGGYEGGASSSSALVGKSLAASQLRSRLRLPDGLHPSSGAKVPLVCCLLFQASEGDVLLVEQAVQLAMQLGAQFVLLGSSRSPRVQAALEELQRESQPDSVRLLLHYEEELAHQIMAAADILLCPALMHDPMAQLPLIALKYGALPVTAATIKDSAGRCSLIDFDEARRSNQPGAAAFLYSSPQPSEVMATLTRAIQRYMTDPDGWSFLALKSMAVDTSWDGGACDAYIEAYNRAIRAN